jgi:hypothetical protein
VAFIDSLGPLPDVSFDVVLPDRCRISVGAGSPAFEWSFRKQAALLATLTRGHIGLLEAYFDQDVDIGGDMGAAFAAAMPVASTRRADRPTERRTRSGVDLLEPLVRASEGERELALRPRQRLLPAMARRPVADGVGIEATSFRAGLVHDSVVEIDVLLPSGEIATCTPDNEHRDLYFGFANSYGALGYGFRFRVRTRPVKPYVLVRHLLHDQEARYFADLATACSDASADFVDGVVFAPDKLVLTTATFVDSASWLSDY